MSEPEEEILGAGPAYIEALKKFGNGDPTKADLRKMETELYNGPDRGAAVVLASLVEKSIEKLLRNRLRSDGIENLFKYGGPLGDFSSKIEMAYAANMTITNPAARA